MLFRSRRPMIPQKGEEISGRIIEENAILQFTATFLGIKTGDRVPLLMLNKPLTYTRTQRRNYYRHPVVLDIEIAVVQNDNLDQQVSGLQNVAHEWIAVKTLDIGGGGIRMASPVKLEKGIKLELKIPIGGSGDKNMDTILVKGQVMREETSDRNSYIYGVGYIDIKEAQRDRIINYIFSLSRKRMF